MVNITLILLLLHYIGLHIFKPKLDTLNCGIGGYIGNNFNKYKFNILGLYNDTRGGDSCGIVYEDDNNIEVKYGHDKTKFYKNFVESGELKDVNLQSPNFALLHCRKASVGGISLATAQPVVIRDENNKIIFSMIHNGTLVNYKELATKYNVKFELFETDSQIFCKTVYKAGYKVLSEYDGAGAFVFWDGRDGCDTIKVFKGASLYYENDKDLYIERPLFCIKEENSFWFSSIEESLKFINDTNAEVISVESNILFTIKNGRIIGEDKVDRSERKQSERLVYNGKNIPVRYNNSEYIDYWDEYDSYPNYNTQYPGVNSYSFTNRKTDSILTPYKQKNKIYFNIDGLYYINGDLCDGPIESSPAGYTDIKSVNQAMYYFVSGVLMYSYFDYLCARQYINQYFGNEDDALEMYLSAYSPTPVPWRFIGEKNEEYIEFYVYNKKLRDSELYTGWFEPFFDFKRNRYMVNMGEITWHYEYKDTGSFYKISEEKLELDNKILSGEISKNQLKKLIKNNLRTTYVKG